MKSIIKFSLSIAVSVVAMGAAVQGAVLAGDVKDVLLLDVTPLSLGIETFGSVMTKLIDKNTTIPVKKSQVFSTAVDNQTAVSIHVLQGEREFASDNKTLGRFDLVGIPPAPKGMPQVEVTFDIDANGIVHVSAKDKATGKEQSIQITSSSGLSEDEINQMVKDAEANEAQDKERRKLVDARNNLDAMIYAVEKSLTEVGDKAGDDVKQPAQAAVEAAKKVLESENLEEIEKATKDLTEKSHKLAEIVYKDAQAQQAAAGAQPGAEGATGAAPGGDAGASKTKSDDETVIDADFKEV